MTFTSVTTELYPSCIYLSGFFGILWSNVYVRITIVQRKLMWMQLIRTSYHLPVREKKLSGHNSIHSTQETEEGRL